MFQDGSDGVPANSPQTLSTQTSSYPDTQTRSGRNALQAVSPSQLTLSGVKSPCLAAGAAEIPQPSSQPIPAPSVTLPPRREGATFQGGLRQPGGRSWRSSCRKCTGQHRAPRQGPSPLGDRSTHQGPVNSQLNSAGRLLWAHPFASKRFHILFNSLFKVFFNFPSRYLLAIGLAAVFSLRWSLPPTLGCIPKQPDSEDFAKAMAATTLEA